MGRLSSAKGTRSCKKTSQQINSKQQVLKNIKKEFFSKITPIF